MNKKEVKKRTFRFLRFLFSLIIIIALGFLLYFAVFHVERCMNEECFSQNLITCKRTEYINDAEGAVFFYNILKEKENICQVKVTLLQIKKGQVDLSILEDKEMICDLPLGTYVMPEQDLKKCTGKLKESIQEIIIKRMYSQLIENVGDVQEEITKIL